MLEALEAAWRDASTPRLRVDAANRLIEQLLPVDIARAQLLAEQTIAEARAAEHIVGEAGALRHRAVCRLVQADLDGAEEDYHEALAQSRRVQAIEIEAACLLGLSTLARKATDYTQAMTLLLQARQLRRGQDDHRGEVAALNNLGALCVELGSYDQALAFLLEGLTIARANQLDEYEVFCLANISGIKRDAGDLTGAVADLDTCLALAERLGNRYVRPHLLAALCEAYLKQGRIEEALRVNEEALALASVGADRQVELSLLVHLGMICDELGMPEAAEAAFTRALERTERLGDLERRLETLCQTAAFYQRQERFAEACITFEEALQQATSAGARRHLPRILHGLAALDATQAESYREQELRIQAELTQQAEQSRTLALEALKS
jgi:tetratricopeptide (TPR) repeat protein